MTITRQELFSEIDELAKECHRLACAAELGEERTELFEIYNVLRNLGRQGYAQQVGRQMNPLLSFGCDNDYEEDEE